MLPFVFLDETKLGPFHAYGICCALGFFAWDWAFMREVRKKGLDRADYRVLTILLLAVGTFFAWWIDAVFYHSGERSVASSLFSFQGFSATGGFVGALVGGLFWHRVYIGRRDGKLRIAKRETPVALLPVSDLVVSTWAVPFALGRLGCALIHDHPGITTPKGTLGSLLTVAWPRGPSDGVHHVLGPLHVVTGGSDARFDLGLLEFFFLAGLALFFMSRWDKPVRTGTFTIIGTIGYGSVRFFLDFLRMADGEAGDLRHGGLTFAQYWAFAVVGLGVTLLVRRRLRPARPPAAVAAASRAE